jgi:hypothetical protein
MNQRVALKALAGMPPSRADDILKLLAERPPLLTCGAVKYGSRMRAAATFPARRLIRRFAAAAKAEVVIAAEKSVRSVVPLAEIRNWRYAHERFMGGLPWSSSKCSIYPRTLFATQYALLSAFPENVLSVEGEDWRGVLSRKFGPVSAVLKEPPRSWAGSVTSPIPQSRALRMSDRSWMRLVQSERISPENRFRGRRGHELQESTPELFARQLQLAAHLEPSRFAELAMKFPLTVRTDYLSAILNALSKEKPPEKENVGWSEAPAAAIEAVMTRFAFALDDRQLAMHSCWVLHNRPEEPWTAATINRLVEMARSHPDPARGEAAVFDGGGASDALKPNYPATAINCVRGVAAWAVASLLFSDPKRLPLLRPAIDAFIHDPHPSVRIAATRIALPLLNLDRDGAVEYCVTLNSMEDDSVLEGHELSQFLGYSLRSHFNHLEPLLRRMLISDRDPIAERGAEWVTLCYLYDGRLGEDLQEMLTGRLAHRKGVAQVLSRELVRGSLISNGDEILVQLLDDPDKDVQGTAARVFWHPEIYELPNARHLLEAFARSGAAVRELDAVFHGLNETSARIDHFADAIGQLVERLLSVKANGADNPMFATFSLPDVLLRLYEESEPESGARKRCLDYFDAALRGGLAFDLLQKIERRE